MKYYNNFLLGAICLTALASCADNNTLGFAVSEPDSLANVESLKKYDALKNYVDRTANPNFKLGTGATVSEYNQKGLMYRLINSNYDEMTAGYGMKHGAVVQSDGSLDLSSVREFLSNAQLAGVSVFGHTLCWHANQNATYLNSLIAPTAAPGGSYMKELVTNGDFEGTDMTCFPISAAAISGTAAGKDGTGKSFSVKNPAVQANDWGCQWFLLLPQTLKKGDIVEFSMDIRADAESSVATQSHGNPGSYMIWYAVGTIPYTTSWTHYSTSITIDDKVEAIGYKDGKEVCRTEKHTVGNPASLKLTLISNPAGTKADGNDVALVQVEVVDDKGERCPLANDMVEFSLNGPAEWRGGIDKAADKYALSKKLPVEAGVNRVMVRATREAGIVKLTAKADGLSEQTISFQTTAVDCKEGLSSYIPGETQPSYYGKGAVKSTPSYTQKNIALAVDSITAGSNQADACKSIDDNEMTEWASTGNDAWITYRLARRALIDDVCLKLTGWRKKSYPVEILEGDSVVWRGETPKSLGYIHLFIDHPVMSDRITIRLTGTASDQDAFGAIVEVEDQNAGTLDMVDKGGKQLRIIEAEFRERLIKE